MDADPAGSREPDYDEDEDPLAGTTFGLARDAGRFEWTEDGPLVTWYPNMQVSTVLNLLSQSADHFSGGSYIRLRRHIMVVAPKGWGKTSSTKTWLKHGAGAVREVNSSPSDQTQLELGGSQFSWEWLRGSADNNGNIIPPKLAKADYLFCSELFDVIGENPAQSNNDMASHLLSALEEGDITVGLIKLAGTELDAEQRRMLNEMGVEVDTAEGQMSYRADFTMYACARPFTDQQYRTLEHTGFLDRFFISIWKPPADKARELRAARRNPDLNTLHHIRSVNKHLEDIRVREIPRPPMDYRDEVLQSDEDISEDFIKMGYDPGDVYSGRDPVVVEQLLAAASFERMGRKLDPMQNEEGYLIDTLEYTEGDVEVAKYFYRDYIERRLSDVLEKRDASETRLRRRDIERLKATAQEVDDTVNITPSSLRNAFTEACDVTRRTYYRVRRRAINAGVLKKNHISNTYTINVGLLDKLDKSSKKPDGVGPYGN